MRFFVNAYVSSSSERHPFPYFAEWYSEKNKGGTK